MSDHTPDDTVSRWVASKRADGHHTIKLNEGYLPMVADVYGTDAEAQLIAVAPELLATLEQVNQRLTDGSVESWQQLHMQVKAVIARAGGGKR